MATVARDSRVAIALAGEAWAYLDSLHRNATAAATTLLVSFQQDFNQWRDSLVALAQDPATVDAQLPASLAVDGVYGPNSRMALLFSLATADQRLRSTAASMPRYAGQLGAWFWDRLQTIFPRDTSDPMGQTLWNAANQARINADEMAGFMVQAWAMAFAQGLETGAPQITQAGNSQAQQIIEQSTPPILQAGGGQGIPTPAPPPAPAPTPSPSMQFTPSADCVSSDRYLSQGKDAQGRCIFRDTQTGELVAFSAGARGEFEQTRGGTDPYLLPAVIAGVVVLGGAMGYQIWRKRGGRR